MKSVEDIVLLGLIYTDRKILLKTFKGEFSFFKLEGESKLV
jgi:hypothetical protein